MDKKSKLGYSKRSPYRDSPYLDIFTPEGTIDMSNTDIPLMATDETGYSKLLQPYSGMHQFNGTNVREVPYNKYQAGGKSMQDLYDFLFEDDQEDQPKNTAPAESEVESTEPQQQQQNQDPDLAMAIALEDSDNRRRRPSYDPDGRISLPPNAVYDGKAIASGSAANFAFKYYQEKGVAPHIAAGIVGNLMQESGLNPYAKGDNGQATGVAQWHPDRFSGLQKFAGNRNPYDLKTQLDYVLYEANQRGDLQALQGTKDAGEAAYHFARRYERPKVIDNKRIGYAKGLYPQK
jgi:hypothetical protein